MLKCAQGFIHNYEMNHCLKWFVRFLNEFEHGLLHVWNVYIKLYEKRVRTINNNVNMLKIDKC